MKITASRREDLLKERDEYNATREASQKRYDEQQQAYHQAQYDVTDPIQKQVESAIKNCGLSDVEVRVDPYGRFSSSGSSGVSISIRVNERNKFEDTTALSWNYDVYLHEDGTPVKESSSWSGLKAVTAEQMSDLQNTLKALQWLNSVDWTALLGVKTPEYRDYISERVPEDRSKEFDDQLVELDIEEAVGTNKLLLGGPIEEPSRWSRGQQYWYRIVKETPKRYVVEQYSARYSDEEIRQALSISTGKFGNYYSQGVTKEKFLRIIDRPLVWKEV